MTFKNIKLFKIEGANDVSKRESSMSLHYRLFAGTHVPDIVVISGQGAGSSTSKEEILAELKEMSKTLEETIKSSTERKISVDNLINALSAQKKDEDIAEGNEDVDGNDVAGNSNPGGGNVQDFRGNH
jgi:hypothetical protein